MAVPILTFFNNKGGVGKTSLVYHLAWMYSCLDKRVVLADLDPQSNLTAACLDDDTIEDIWNIQSRGATIYQCLHPLANIGDLREPELQTIDSNIFLLPGDVRLSGFEETLSDMWPGSMGDNNLYRPMRILSSFWTVVQAAAKATDADLILVDIGPNLGAINRSVLIATDYVAIPLGADLFSLQGLQNLGPTLRTWRNLWKKRMINWNENQESSEHEDFTLPAGEMQPIGYLYQQYGVRKDRPVQAYEKWINRIPQTYAQYVLEKKLETPIKPEDDPNWLGQIKHFRSLIPMAQEAHKPIFLLNSADGAIGSHASAVSRAYKDFEKLAKKIAPKIKLKL